MRIGLLTVPPPQSPPGPLRKILIDTLRELGWVEGVNVVYDPEHAGNDQARLPEAAAALVARRPDVIYAGNAPIAQAVLGVTRTIPIICSAMPDAVELGLIKSYAQPGGNVTGIAVFAAELGPRRLQLIKEFLPRATRIAVLTTGSHSSTKEHQLIEKAAASAGMKVLITPAATPNDIPKAFAALEASKPDALLLTTTALYMSERKTIMEHAAKMRLPVIAYRSEQAALGALLSYNSSLTDHTRAAARIVDKVLKGTRPADIPVERPTKFELVLNMKTARALGLAVPQSLLLQADRVIE